MIYIKNKGEQALTFKVMKEDKEVVKEVVLAFDCERIYQDTGNVFTTGITPVNEADYDWFYANVKVFKDFCDRGILVKTAEPVNVEAKADALEKENAKLKAEAKEAEKAKKEAEKAKVEAEKAKEEAKNLKAELEKLKKGTTKKSSSSKEESF